MKNDYNRFSFFEKRENECTFYFMDIDKKWIQVSKKNYTICKNSYRKMKWDNESLGLRPAIYYL